jgi:Ca2+-binding EF-hand superfamily protein
MKKNSLLVAAFVLIGLGAFAQRSGGHGGGGGGGGRGGRPGGGEGGQGEKMTPMQILAMLDKNNDGKIDKSEAQNSPNKRFAEKFDSLDVNKDGFIDQEELANMGKPDGNKPAALNAKKILMLADMNKDGKLDKEELSQKNDKYLLKNFDRIDLNADGFLNKKELSKFVKASKKIPQG